MLTVTELQLTAIWCVLERLSCGDIEILMSDSHRGLSCELAFPIPYSDSAVLRRNTPLFGKPKVFDEGNE